MEQYISMESAYLHVVRSLDIVIRSLDLVNWSLDISIPYIYTDYASTSRSTHTIPRASRNSKEDKHKKGTRGEKARGSVWSLDLVGLGLVGNGHRLYVCRCRH
jgi:hypothetical protein